VDRDERGFRVALVAGELVNPTDGELDALAVLEEEGWGAMQLPAADYPDEVAAPLLDHVAEQTDEFARNGYTLAVVRGRAGLDEALARSGVPAPPAADPATADELRAFLAEVAG
jgi:hypothetical protein